MDAERPCRWESWKRQFDQPVCVCGQFAEHAGRSEWEVSWILYSKYRRGNPNRRRISSNCHRCFFFIRRCFCCGCRSRKASEAAVVANGAAIFTAVGAGFVLAGAIVALAAYVCGYIK